MKNWLIFLALSGFSLVAAAEPEGRSEPPEFVGEILRNLDSRGEKQLPDLTVVGEKFKGYIEAEDESQTLGRIWAENPSIPPDEAKKIWRQIVHAVEAELGEGSLVSAPNFEDGSSRTDESMVWILGDEIVLISVIAYSRRASVGFERNTLNYFHAQLGADSGQFWRQALAVISASRDGKAQ